MAKTDWSNVVAEYQAAHAKTGISAKEWCAQGGINYHSARRYLSSRGQSPASPKARKTGQPVQAGEKGRGKKSASSRHTQAEAGRHANNNMASGRDEHGRFTEGHRESVGNPGNPNPPANIKPGMQLTKTHGGYAKYLDAGELFDAAQEMQLCDELDFTRARALSVTKVLAGLRADLEQCDDLGQRIELYDKLLKAEAALDRNVGRIESLERSLRAIKVDEARIPHINAATRKLQVETDKLEQEGGADMTPIGEVTAALQEMGSGGLMR